MVFRDDFHIHASYYRLATAPNNGPRVADQIKAAEEAGADRIGILEHCNASPRHPFQSLRELRDEFRSLHLDPSRRFRGVEADLLPGGLDSCGDAGKKELALDYIIGSVHLSPKVIPDFSAYLGEEFSRIMHALLYNPRVDIIGHPFISGERYERNGTIEHWDYSLVPPQWLDEIIETAVQKKKALEINYLDLEDPAYLNFLRKMKEAGVLFTLGSDAHCTERCVQLGKVHALAEKLNFDSVNQWFPGRGDQQDS